MAFQIPTADHLRQVANQGYITYRKSVLEGPLFKKILRKIEDAAIIGGTSWECLIESDEEYRTLKVIQAELQGHGYDCKFKYLPTIQRPWYFVVAWG
ncbi:hypothetical protein C3943_13020 [Lysinibacillus sp. B2A1]|nr:hypothetical protein C3943_13020 [Lysinibacillus sp. B2A1]